jgi:hypothetical protein
MALHRADASVSAHVGNGDAGVWLACLRLKHGNLGAWLKTFLHSDDVLLDFHDPLPFLMQLRSILGISESGNEAEYFRAGGIHI